MLAGDESSSAYLHVAQILAAHLVVQQVPGEPSQLSRLSDRVASRSAAKPEVTWLSDASTAYLREHGHHPKMHVK